MLVSEQASAQGDLADHLPGASTFPGTPTSGGWIPILAQPKEGGRPFIIDWSCPRCLRLTGNYRTCPGCGLEVLASPKKILPILKSRKIFVYQRWADELFEDDENHGGRTSRFEAIREITSRERPGKGTKNRWCKAPASRYQKNIRKK